MQKSFFIKKVAVLGAGVMGAQIAAHCINAGIETLLFDLASSEENRNQLANQAIMGLSKLKPPPLGARQMELCLQAKNYEDDLPDLSGCDLIIEAIAERIDWKTNLYQTVLPYLNEQAILVSNTSGLSINQLAESLPPFLRLRFCGMHFFNPPRYMHLVELIPAKTTVPSLVDHLETWLTSYLGKGVVRAKDTPNFIANRIGVFSLLSCLHHAAAMNLGFDEVDALTGPLLGRPKSATFRTMDVVGLDTLKHVVDTMQQQLKKDPWHSYFCLPDWLLEFIQQSRLGQKSGEGIYRKSTQGIEVYDPASRLYRPAAGRVNDEVKAILKNTKLDQAMSQLFHSQIKQAQFLAAYYRDLFHYAVYHLESIAETVLDVDLALRWGFGWAKGPFELWQAAGKELIENLIENKSQTTSSKSILCPSWLEAITQFYTNEGAYSPEKRDYLPPSALPIYQRQFFPEKGIPEKIISKKEILEKEILEVATSEKGMFEKEIPEKGMLEKEIPEKVILVEKINQVATGNIKSSLFSNEAINLWLLQREVPVLRFKTKANSINQAVLDGLEEALEIAEQHYGGLIIYQDDPLQFSLGADVEAIASLIQRQNYVALEAMVKQFQNLLLRMKYSAIPIVAALRGRALGGGCELMMHCAVIMAAFESYPGLVEIGLGLIPAGGGCKEMARRAAVKASNKTDLLLFLEPYFHQIATAFIAGSAIEAKASGFLLDGDKWVMHSNEVLFAAYSQIQMMQAINYQPPLKSTFKVAGREGHARLEMKLINWLEGGYISSHDYFIANQLAKVICGGEVNQGEEVDENWIFNLEREAFMTLARNPLTQARINGFWKQESL